MIGNFSVDTHTLTAAAPDTYDATVSSPRRRAPRTTTGSEDSHANERRRRILSASTRDLARNMVVAAWAIRKHLDYVADFTFQAATPDRKYNEYFEGVWKEVTKKHRFDAAARHNHRRAVRLAEAGKVVDGRLFWMKLAPGLGNPLRGAIQRIEGDLVEMPSGSIPSNSNSAEWVNGTRIDPATTRALAYAICKRVGATRKEFQRIVSARNIIPHEAYEFRNDQVAGLSPINSALNWFQDTKEGFDFAMAKLKVGQLFGVAIKTKASESQYGQVGENTGDDDEDDDSDDTTEEPKMVLGQGPFVSELDVGEEVDMIESKNPSTETVAFLKLMIHIALRSMDIPFSFFDESFTNFYGSRGGLVQYLHSCNQKVLDLQEFLEEHARWRLGLAVADGELELPSGKDFDWLKFEFVPGGVPWWDTAKEVRGAGMAIAIGQTSPQDICKQTGSNFYRNVDQIADAQAYCREKGVTLYLGDSIFQKAADTAEEEEKAAAAAEAAEANAE